jgi:hypothetical protein
MGWWLGAPILVCICRICGFAAEPTLELLIRNPLDSRVPAAPTPTEWDLKPLVDNCTLRGSDFLSFGSSHAGVALTR